MADTAKNSSTTVVFVPGGWHEPKIFDKISSKVRDDGYNTDYVYLPSISGPDVGSVTDLGPDVREIRKHILKAAEDGQKVVVFSHSYGSVPASEAVQGLSWKERQAGGQLGGVTHYFACNGMIVAAGTSCLDFSGGAAPSFWEISEDGKTCFPKNAEWLMYNELAEEDQKEWVGRLKWMSYRVAGARLGYAAWEKVPSTYVYSTHDTVFVPELQKEMIRRVGEEHFRSETVDSSHTPMILLKADEIAAAVGRAAQIEV